MDFASVLEMTALDWVLLALLVVLFWRWLRRRGEPEVTQPKPPTVKPLPKQDMSLKELRKYDGVQDEHILFALNGTIYDVSRGRNFYGPGGPYGALAGRDATRALSTMDVKDVRDEWDDHEGLTADEKETANEWEASFKFKYPTVGKLIKDGEVRVDYGGAISSTQN
ncbi:cytochrome b5-like Heme/Steroid binding domain protein [Teladorsagia circumcincta]|uniref:Cytochrome b5-like Heme/Steroid binding domain protein n=1 Tax=Teladorsagia circumcincta TaxID=45464 RepID=A0A2G9UNE4_TELCI|nr:cytochrome b5-like Heme/Steroid binding domain protein [Teladorsagia circumcincta]